MKASKIIPHIMAYESPWRYQSFVYKDIMREMMIRIRDEYYKENNSNE